MSRRSPDPLARLPVITSIVVSPAQRPKHTRAESASKVYLSLSSQETRSSPAPNENLSSERRRTGIRIGDVGIQRGKNESFEPLFNALVPAGAVDQTWGVPEGFVPFKVGAGKNVVKWKGYHAPGTIIAQRMEYGASLTLGGDSTLSP
uniref:Uncharacterized protein n=1 Tax=Mycena chlorophos TaxID=658473 RepID=A0ABQ0KXE1_MYCCL|nr:predicted protein [Mycena chlorophos]